MAQQKQIDQGSTKYPRESAWPTEAEEEGLQAAGEPPHALQRAAQRSLPQATTKGRGGGRGGEGGWEQKERSQGTLPQEQVMEEAFTGMPVQIQGEGDDVRLSHSRRWGWEKDMQAYGYGIGSYAIDTH